MNIEKGLHPGGSTQRSGLRPGGSISQRNKTGSAGREICSATLHLQKQRDFQSTNANDATSKASGQIFEVHITTTNGTEEKDSEGRMEMEHRNDRQTNLYNCNSSHMSTTKKSKNQQKKYPPNSKLKMNSRASLWASSEKVEIGNNIHDGTGNQKRIPNADVDSQSRAKGVWAASRADMENNYKTTAKSKADNRSCAHDRVEHKKSSPSGSLIGPDCGHSLARLPHTKVDSRSRAKGVWAAARAEMGKNGKAIAGSKADSKSFSHDMTKDNSLSFSGSSIGPDCGPSLARLPNGNVVSQLRAKEARAANRAEMEHNGKTIAGSNADAKSSTHDWARNNNHSFSGSSIGPDCGPSFAIKSAIRHKWNKIDSHHAKSQMEEEMETLFALLSGAEVGILSTISAGLPIEIYGEGGYTDTVQDQMLTDATIKMMDRWATHSKWTKDEARLAGQILLRMEREEIFINETTSDDPAYVLLKKQDYLAVINAYAKVTFEDETASIRADNLLDHMEKRGSEGRSDLKPDRLMINTVIGAQAKHALCGTLSLESISAAERMLDTLEREYEFGDNTMQPTARTYSKLIDLYAKHGMANDASRALERMETQFRKGNKAALPTTIHYTSVIDALAKSADSSGRAARTAEQILRSMLDLYDKGQCNLAPDSIIFSVVINAIAKCKRSDAAERSLCVLELMGNYQVEPDIVTYNTVLNTLSLDPTYHIKARSILEFIEGDSYLRADSFTYNAVIKGSLPNEAEKLIQHWEMEYKKGNTDERPDSYSYTSLIRSWIKTNTIGFEEKCANILRWMEEETVVGMNRVVYNEVMKAFSRSMRNDAGALTQGVFEQLLEVYNRSRDRDFRPDRFSYIALLNAYCRSCTNREHALKAESVLYEMMNSHFLPDSKLCNNVVSAWARSHSRDAPAHAERICERMDVLGIPVDGVVFNSLMNVYSQNGAISNAFKVLDRMTERGVGTSSVTYTFLLEACMGDEEAIIQVFESCIKHGMLDERLRKSFAQHGPSCVKEQLSCNVPYIWGENAHRGPGGPSRGKLKSQRKRGDTGADIKRVGWAR